MAIDTNADHHYGLTEKLEADPREAMRDVSVFQIIFENECGGHLLL